MILFFLLFENFIRFFLFAAENFFSFFTPSKHEAENAQQESERDIESEREIE